MYRGQHRLLAGRAALQNLDPFMVFALSCCSQQEEHGQRGETNTASDEGPRRFGDDHDDPRHDDGDDE
jgi:hypothetical protein